MRPISYLKTVRYKESLDSKVGIQRQKSRFLNQFIAENGIFAIPVGLQRHDYPITCRWTEEQNWPQNRESPSTRLSAPVSRVPCPESRVPLLCLDARRKRELE